MHRQSLASPAASPGSGRAGALLSGLLWLLLGITCASAEERPPLRVMTDYWPPFRMEGEGGALHGLDIDLLNGSRGARACVSTCNGRPGHAGWPRCRAARRT